MQTRRREISMNFKFRTKLYVVFSVIILFAAASFSLFIRMHIFKQMEEESAHNDMQLCIKISENVDTYIEKMDDITKKLISNPGLLQIMREVKNNPKALSDYEELKRNREIAAIVSNAITLTSFPHVNVYLYSQDGSFSYIYNQHKSNFESALTMEDNGEKLGRKELVIYADHDSGAPDEQGATISFIRAVFDVSANRYGYIEVQSDYKKLDEICNINHIGNVFLLNDKGDIVYPSSSVSAEESGLFKRNLAQKNKSGVFSMENHMYFYASSDYSGITTYIQYPKDTIYSSMKLLQHTTIIFFVCVTAAAILMVVVFSRMLVKPLQELRNSVLKVTYENMGLNLEDVSNNEIIELKDAFQKILDDLKLAAFREIESNKAEAGARLSALQAQISPHFIHNVLYSISISAREGRTEDAQAMCKQLSDMLRYTVNSNAHTVTLGEEIQYITNYLALQKQYYEDFLQYQIEVQEEARSILIPRLCILPFVENAIQHAFEGQKPPYHICVTAIASDGKWRVEVRDNGRGFSRDKIKEIENRMKEESLVINMEDSPEGEPGMGGLGILNTLLRLRIFFAGDFEFSIKNNSPAEGAAVCLGGRFISEDE